MYDDGANSLLRAREREAHAPNASKQLQNSDISGVSDLSTKLWPRRMDEVRSASKC
jgi:hypothetical protein